MAAICPECDADLDVDEFDVEEDEELSCPECGQTLRVVTVSPLELESVDDEEDEEEEEEEEEEEDEDGDEEEEFEDDDEGGDDEEDEGDWDE